MDLSNLIIQNKDFVKIITIYSPRGPPDFFFLCKCETLLIMKKDKEVLQI